VPKVLGRRGRSDGGAGLGFVVTTEEYFGRPRAEHRQDPGRICLRPATVAIVVSQPADEMPNVVGMAGAAVEVLGPRLASRSPRPRAKSIVVFQAGPARPCTAIS
jgi:hypothetical protein